MREKYSPASNLALYRKEKKLTQASLGSILVVSRQYVSDMEHERPSISREMAKKIAADLDFPYPCSCEVTERIRFPFLTSGGKMYP